MLFLVSRCETSCIQQYLRLCDSEQQAEHHDWLSGPCGGERRARVGEGRRARLRLRRVVDARSSEWQLERERQEHSIYVRSQLNLELHVTTRV